MFKWFSVKKSTSFGLELAKLVEEHGLNREELNDFVKELLALPYVERTGTQLVLNTVKEEKRVLF